MEFGQCDGKVVSPRSSTAVTSRRDVSGDGNTTVPDSASGGDLSPSPDECRLLAISGGVVDSAWKIELIPFDCKNRASPDAPNARVKSSLTSNGHDSSRQNCAILSRITNSKKAADNEEVSFMRRPNISPDSYLSSTSIIFGWIQ